MNSKSKKIIQNTLTAVALITASSVHAAITVFSADFDDVVATELTFALGSPSTGYGAVITEANLNAGTAIGSWTEDVDQVAPVRLTHKQIQTDGAANVANKALRFGISLDGPTGPDNAMLTANLTSNLALTHLISVSFDYGIISGDGSSGNPRTTYMTGLDSSDNRLFQIGFVNTTSGGRQMGYFDTSGAWTLIGTSGDLIGNNNTSWNAALMRNVTVDIGASTYDIKLDGATLIGGGGIAFRDAGASGLDSLALSSSNAFTGGAFDNMTVTQVPEPSSTALLGLGGLALILRRRRS